MLDALGVELDALAVILGQHGIIAADLLHETAVARHTRFGDHDAIVGPLLGTAAGEANFQ